MHSDDRGLVGSVEKTVVWMFSSHCKYVSFQRGSEVYRGHHCSAEAAKETQYNNKKQAKNQRKEDKGT